MRDENEQILVVERKLVESLGMFQGLTFDMERYLPVLLAPRNYRFVPRGPAEQDESLKQLIPYFVIVHGDCVWCYTRGKKSGEDRLVAKVSIGIGGHINNEDLNLLEDLYTTAARRELEEEVLVPAGSTDRIVALLNDDSTPVGRVHLGVIHVLRAAGPEVRRRESVITESGFRTVPGLQALRDRMETWSQICFDALPELLRRAG
jgi:predicted NUDIX family phosphoesterase